MPTSGDVVDLDLGLPGGREAGFRHPAVVASAQRILEADPSIVFVVPLTSTLRDFHSEITIEPDEHNGLTARAAAQCQHLRSVSTGRIAATTENRDHTTPIAPSSWDIATSPIRLLVAMGRSSAG
jgi:mRNA interferase MazF